MTTFTLTIKCDNAAFCADSSEPNDYYRGAEVARILRETADWFETGGLMRYLTDANGNTVGVAEYADQ